VSLDLAPYEALDRLNSAVRARCHVPARAVYAMKRNAIKQAHQDGLIDRYRRIGMDVKCHDCGGTGRYTHWSGDEYDHCWACRNTGTAHLVFIETRLAGDILWHSPTREFPYLGADFQLPACEEHPGDWNVNAPGKPLTVSEIARDILVTERAFRRPGIGWSYSIHETESYAYKLYLGETEHSCRFCGVAINVDDWKTYHRYGVSRDRLEWSDYACNECSAKYPAHFTWGVKQASIFDDFPVPVALLQDEHVRAWVRKHCTDPGILAASEQEPNALENHGGIQ
jgi:hypothetical protein